ncbi:hypothetical protein [Jannaschia sp. LMIT008]|uniref:hypothetical protein n=1 Tax=Jannaschia maritima TaxID=3032585 RepID=UPI002810EC5A|nr:hypothetical protein [Jannaschia sp. LMIT008]
MAQGIAQFGAVALAPHEDIRFDTAVLEALCDAHGTFAEEVIAGALFRIEERLSLAAWQAEQGETRGLRRTAEELARLAREIGMTTLRHAADAVVDACPDEDPAAAGACIARLTRLSRPGALTQARIDTGTVA